LPNYWIARILIRTIWGYDTDSALPTENKTRVSSGREQGSSIVSNIESQLEQA